MLVKDESEQNEQHRADHSTIHVMQQCAPPESIAVTSATTRGKHVAVAVHFSNNQERKSKKSKKKTTNAIRLSAMQSGSESNGSDIHLKN